MLDFDLAKFDYEFLTKLADSGINITEYNLKTEIFYTPLGDMAVRGNLFRKDMGTLGSFSFAYTLPNDVLDVESVCALRAAYRTRDFFFPWRMDVPEYIEKYLDERYPDEVDL